MKKHIMTILIVILSFTTIFSPYSGRSRRMTDPT